MRTEVHITSEFITLGQFLKFENLIESGGSLLRGISGLY